MNGTHARVSHRRRLRDIVQHAYQTKSRQGYAPSLTLTLQESQDVLLTDGALHVTDDGSVDVVHELNTDLSDTTTRTSPAEDLEMKIGRGQIHAL